MCALIASGVVECRPEAPVDPGDGAVDNFVSFINTTEMGTDILEIASGMLMDCALASSGSVWCWVGGPVYLQTAETITPIPFEITGLPTNVRAITVGGLHGCAVSGEGMVWCWGDNTYGQLGDGTTTSPETAVAVRGLGEPVQALAAGLSHACALTTEGNVWCWGNNQSGQLGDGTTDSHASPVRVIGLNREIQAIVASSVSESTCALDTTQTAWCWGVNTYGQLGDGTTINRYTPVAVIGIPNH